MAAVTDEHRFCGNPEAQEAFHVLEEKMGGFLELPYGSEVMALWRFFANECQVTGSLRAEH
jgi:hypothetical protein